MSVPHIILLSRPSVLPKTIKFGGDRPMTKFWQNKLKFFFWGGRRVTPCI